MYKKRKIEDRLRQACKTFPACLITGPRQSGKTTLLRNTFPNHTYVSLDVEWERAKAKRDPMLFLSEYDTPLIIDEIQYAPELLPAIKVAVDNNRNQAGQFILTGSQIFHLMEGVSESLAGRIAVFHLYPFSFEEISPKEKLIPQIHKGFYPEPVLKKDLDLEMWFSSYINTYVERDVRNIKAIADIDRFQDLLVLLAARAGQLINYSEISKKLGVSHTTVKDWISILRSTYIIYLLRPYHNNHSKRVVKSPKLYFVDTGLLCHLLGIDTPERLRKGFDFGHIFENMVIMEAVKRLGSQPSRWQCFFYRTHDGTEIDLITQFKGQTKAYEIKYAKSISPKMTKHLEQFAKSPDISSAEVLSMEESSHMVTRSVKAVHWTHVLK